MFSTLFGFLLTTAAIIVVLNLVIGVIAYANDYFDSEDQSYECFDFTKAATFAIAGASIIFIRVFRKVREVITTELDVTKDDE